MFGSIRASLELVSMGLGLESGIMDGGKVDAMIQGISLEPKAMGSSVNPGWTDVEVCG